MHVACPTYLTFHHVITLTAKRSLTLTKLLYVGLIICISFLLHILIAAEFKV
jgi:hypothetical protein